MAILKVKKQVGINYRGEKTIYFNVIEWIDAGFWFAHSAYFDTVKKAEEYIRNFKDHS